MAELTKKCYAMQERTGIMKKWDDLCKIDSLGRMVVPKRLRNAFDLKAGDSLEIYIDDQTIVLKKYISCCTFCGNENYLTEKNGKYICSECINSFIEISNKN